MKEPPDDSTKDKSSLRPQGIRRKGFEGARWTRSRSPRASTRRDLLPLSSKGPVRRDPRDLFRSSVDLHGPFLAEEVSSRNVSRSSPFLGRGVRELPELAPSCYARCDGATDTWMFSKTFCRSKRREKCGAPGRRDPEGRYAPVDPAHAVISFIGMNLFTCCFSRSSILYGNTDEEGFRRSRPEEVADLFLRGLEAR